MKKLNSKTIEVKDKLESQKLIKVAVFDQNKNKTKPHKHNGYLELVFLYEASGKHVIDGREATVNSPCILIIRKDNVHHWDLKNPVNGHVLLLKKLFVEQSLDFEISRLVEEIINYDTIYLNELAGIDKILEVLAYDEDKISQEGLFKSILAKALSFTTQLKPSMAKQNHLYLSFCELLNNDTKVINHVAHYASLLNTSPQNLNAACKKYVKLTASEILAAHIIKEAKRLLIYTTSSISEIAFELGFSDKSNFSKYFKRYTGVTPSEFKNMEIKTLFPQTHS
ncbi:AraC family transcriptional regulator [Sphingobacterium endophyticum]|uniref:AraC family transcriptional regulator n=1 Tax=Sphingobacterium endophyticum TaxID=2546448 RepID=UPI0012E1F191|nr:helix-turn-helix domain-containing protein [Sphingobacterium endophyticum]